MKGWTNEETVEIRLPYDVTLAGIKSGEFIDVAGRTDIDLGTELEWLYENTRDEEELERIMRSAVCLYHSTNPQLSLAHCIHQGIVWERG